MSKAGAFHDLEVHPILAAVQADDANHRNLGKHRTLNTDNNTTHQLDLKQHRKFFVEGDRR